MQEKSMTIDKVFGYIGLVILIIGFFVWLWGFTGRILTPDPYERPLVGGTRAEYVF